MDSNDIERYATCLNTNGYIVIPILTPVELAEGRTTFLATLGEMPEYNRVEELQFSKTGYGALAVASSFHNPFVRHLRLELYKRLWPIFEQFDSICKQGIHAKDGKIVGLQPRTAKRKFHELMDRMLIRVPGQTPGAESWHQDMSYAVNEDTVFGGWLAFDDQHFSVIEGSHLNDICNPKGGFAAIKKDSALFRECQEKRIVRSIPAGSILLMNQIIVHEVVATKTKTNMLRLFAGWRLTLDHQDLLSKTMRNRNSRQDGSGAGQTLTKVLRDQMVPKVASNQLPSLYNNRSVDTPNQQPALNQWIQTYLKPDLVSMDNERRFYQGTTVVKYAHGLPPIHMPSLATIGKKYAEYEPMEEFILTPQDFDTIRTM